MGRRTAPADHRLQGERTSHRVAREGVGDERAEFLLRIGELEEQLLTQKAANEELRRWYTRLESNRASDRREAEKLKAEKAVLESTVKELRLHISQGPSRKQKDILNKSTYSERVQELAHHVCRMYNHFDLPRLFASVLKKLSKKGQPDLRDMICKSKALFMPALKKIKKERDEVCAKHLREQVYSKEAFALLRLIARLSKRECGLIQQAFKYRRDCNGGRSRTKMASDSVVPAPELFDLKGISQVEHEEMKRTGVELTDVLGGHRCASVTGMYGVDQAIFNAIKATEESRTGGMATIGDCAERAHIICITGDGANLTHGAQVSELPFFGAALSSSTNHSMMSRYLGFIK